MLSRDMDFRSVFMKLGAALEREAIDFALIGGFAMAALKVPRATGDLDFLADGARADDIDSLMHALGYETLHRSSEAANYGSQDELLGRVDFLFARRAYTKAMLARTESHPLFGKIRINVVQAEDLIGLKVQSSSNNPKRMRLDVADIARLIEAHPDLDLERVREYFRLFGRESELDDLLTDRKVR